MLCPSVNVAVLVMAVIVLVKFHPHSVEAVQVVEDVKRKVVLARCRMFVLVHVEGQKRVEGYLLRCDGRIFVLEEVCPSGIDFWAWFAEVKW